MLGAGRRRRRAALLGAAIATSPLLAAASELVPALPHAFVLGSTRGATVAPGVDAAGSHRAETLPGADEAHVAWQRSVPGGIGTHLLVDGAGRIFAAGPARVTQLGADGVMQYSRGAAFSSPVAAALLTDGARAVLTREGRVQAWSASGALVFDIALEAPPPSSSSSLLPLPDGGAVASVGRWLFEIDATRAVRAYACLPVEIAQTSVVGSRTLVVDEQGHVFEWDRRELPRRIGAFGGPLTALIADANALLGLSARRSVERIDRSAGTLRELARLDPPGALAVAQVGVERWVVMKHDGTWFVVPADAPLPVSGQRALPDSPSRIGLLTDSNGTVAWWAADIPLQLETAPGVGRELGEVRCASPIGLVPAGPSRIAAACSSGAIWLIDRAAPSEG